MVPRGDTFYAQMEGTRSEEHTSELQSRSDLVCRLLLEKKKKNQVLPATSTQDMTRLDSLAGTKPSLLLYTAHYLSNTLSADTPLTTTRVRPAHMMIQDT